MSAVSCEVADAQTQRGITQPFCFPRVLFLASAGLSVTEAPGTPALFPFMLCSENGPLVGASGCTVSQGGAGKFEAAEPGSWAWNLAEECDRLAPRSSGV